MSDDHFVVSLDRAAELIGGDKPVSRSTIQRMINAGVLVARGEGSLRRVTMESIRQYLNGETTWPGGDKRATDQPIKTKTANGGRNFRSGINDTGGLVVLTPRTPRPR